MEELEHESDVFFELDLLELDAFFRRFFGGWFSSELIFLPVPDPSDSELELEELPES